MVRQPSTEGMWGAPPAGGMECTRFLGMFIVSCLESVWERGVTNSGSEARTPDENEKRRSRCLGLKRQEGREEDQRPERSGPAGPHSGSRVGGVGQAPPGVAQGTEQNEMQMQNVLVRVSSLSPSAKAEILIFNP